MYAFDYIRPKSLKEVEALLAEHEDAQVLAGGQTLLPTIKQRLAAPSELIDLGAIPELSGITVSEDAVTIGAMTRHAEVANSPEVKRAIPGLAHLAGLIGDPAVRNLGTIGGSLANNDPAADYPGAVLGLGATIHTTRRSIAGDDFFLGMFDTALEEGELITQVSFPIPECSWYEKFRNRASRFALVGAFVARLRDGSVRVAITGAGPCAFRASELEAALARDFRPEALDGVAIAPDNLNSDIHASADYRAHLVPVMAKRALRGALA